MSCVYPSIGLLTPWPPLFNTCVRASTGLLHALLGGWSAPIWFLVLAGLACLVAGFPAGYNRIVGEVPVSAAS